MTDKTRYIKLFGEDRVIFNYENINIDFLNKIAASILNKHMIIVPIRDGLIKEYRICEIEFYLKTDGHNDEYCHACPDQSTYGKWYFHKTKSGGYKGGTFKGIDLTLGESTDEKKSYFGVLIRSIFCEEDNEFIEGPCKVVNKILELNSCKNVQDYLSKQNHSDLLSVRFSKNIHIKRCSGQKKYDIYSGPRIGLSEKYPDFRAQPYRYVIMYDRIIKEKKKLVKILTFEDKIE